MSNAKPTSDQINYIDKSDSEWRAELTPEQYRVLREKGTERAFSGDLWDEHRAGHADHPCASHWDRSLPDATRRRDGPPIRRTTGRQRRAVVTA